jgi:hypothetical protein
MVRKSDLKRIENLFGDMKEISDIQLTASLGFNKGRDD